MAEPRPPAVVVESVVVTYPGPPPVPALRSADLCVSHGEYVTIVGPSGSGKSTLLNVLGLLSRPTAGRYRLDGIDVGSASDHRSAIRGSRIGFVFQEFHLIPHRSALENAVVAQLYNGAARGDRVERAAQALERVGLQHRLRAAPTTMSGGKRQRVAIARAIVNRPSLVLCDEPTGNLDRATAGSIPALLDELVEQDATIVMITHDRDVAARGTRRLQIHDGVVTDVTHLATRTGRR